MTTQYQPEAELLVHCGCPSINAETTAQIKELATVDLNWEYLVQIAQIHRVSPLLYRRLNEVCAATVPDDQLSNLREQAECITRRNLYLSSELFDLLDCLSDHGISTIPYKGPVLTVQAYGDVALRNFCDLDVLVPQKDVPAAIEVLRSQGYSSSSQLNAGQEEALRKYSHEHQFYRKTDKITVKLHWQFLGGDFHIPNDIKRCRRILTR